MALFIHDEAVIWDCSGSEEWALLHEDMFQAMLDMYPGDEPLYNDVTALMLMGGCSGEYYYEYYYV